MRKINVRVMKNDAIIILNGSDIFTFDMEIGGPTPKDKNMVNIVIYYNTDSELLAAGKLIGRISDF